MPTFQPSFQHHVSKHSTHIAHRLQAHPVPGSYTSAHDMDSPRHSHTQPALAAVRPTHGGINSAPAQQHTSTHGCVVQASGQTLVASQAPADALALAIRLNTQLSAAISPSVLCAAWRTAPAATHANSARVARRKSQRICPSRTHAPYSAFAAATSASVVRPYSS